MRIIEQGLEFDDVLIKPLVSQVNSRTEVDISRRIRLSNGSVFELQVPIIASPMKGIVGTELIIELARLGGLGILHRFYNDEEERISDISTLERSGFPYGIAVSFNDSLLKDIIDAIRNKRLKNCSLICIDIANGNTNSYWCAVERLSKSLYDKPVAIMAGNVATEEGARELYLAGADLIRTGIGSGQLCTTRNKTGIGVPQVTAIMNTSRVANVVADGGLRTSGDIVKALASGADFVMLGSMLAKTKESDNNGRVYGMASKELQEQFYTAVKSVEGISKEVEKTTTLEEMINDISWSIKSACTYVNSRNIKDLQGNAQFIRVGSGSIVEK